MSFNPDEIKWQGTTDRRGRLDIENINDNIFTLLLIEKEEERG